MNLESFIGTLKHVAETVGNKVKDFFNDPRLNKNTAEELAHIIINHPRVTKNSRTLLGLTFHKYFFTQDGFVFTIETKGLNNERILCFDIRTEGHDFENIYSYRSYSDSSTLKKKLPFHLN